MAIRAVIEKHVVPEGELREKLTNFLGMRVVRVPGILETIDRFTEDVLKSVARYMTESKTSWESTVAQVKAGGNDIGETSWEQMRDFVRSDDCKLLMRQNWRMSNLVKMLPLAASLMRARKWSVMRAPGDGGGSICSDRPLTICWKGDQGIGPLPPALGMPNTCVMFPVKQVPRTVGLVRGGSSDMRFRRIRCGGLQPLDHLVRTALRLQRTAQLRRNPQRRDDS